MNAPILRFSAAGPSRRSPEDTSAMPPDQIAETVKQVQVMTAEHWYNLLLAFMLGGFTSAMWTWREARRKPGWNEIVSTFFVTGLLAVAFAAYLQDQIATPMVIVISILCGFSGDTIIRIAVRGFRAIVSRFFGASLEPPTKE